MQAQRNQINLLPFIVIGIGVVALLLLIVLRPRSTSRSASAAPTASAELPSEQDIKILLNGQPLSSAQSVRLETTASQSPATWTLGDIAQIAQRGSRTVLIFNDGSKVDVSPTVYRQLPGNVRVRMNYDGPR